MARTKEKYYVVWQGKQPGVYDRWTDCERQVKGVEGARYKSFATRSEAEEAFRMPAPEWKKRTASAVVPTPAGNRKGTHPVFPALAVDAACSGNPGVMEFRGVVADTGTQVFHRGPFQQGTNNIGEFLAIVLGLAYLKKYNLPWVLYSDSRTALAWLRKKHADTKLECTPANQELFRMLRDAEQWLHDNTYTTAVYKWDTEAWGEIPADFGRK